MCWGRIKQWPWHFDNFFVIIRVDDDDEWGTMLRTLCTALAVIEALDTGLLVVVTVAVCVVVTCLWRCLGPFRTFER